MKHTTQGPLHRLRLFILSHGFDAEIDGDSVKWVCPWFNVRTREHGIHVYHARTFGQARDQMGY